MSTAPAEARRTCSYEYQGWHCPFDAEEGHDLCIFHLPTDRKKPEDFWHHLALYLSVLYCCAEGDEASKFWKAGNAWLVGAAAPARIDLKEYYKKKAWGMNPWRFNGFIFPAMDEQHSFRDFVFRATDFMVATFSGEADFSSARFDAEVDFRRATFSGRAGFARATFGGETYFGDARFSGETYFGDAQFSSDASFWDAEFSGKVYFWGATFSGEAYFGGARFSGQAYFWDARFGGEASFWDAKFSGGADFLRATFSGPAYLSRATVNDLLDFSSATLRNRLLFEGTILGDKAMVLLWGLDFVHGTSDISMEKDHEKGQVIEPAGQVVFRDITSGMNRVSFLHTDILTDRLCVRFANVKWETDPKEFIFDARFAFCKKASEWQKATGLTADVIERLPELFHTGRPVPPEETNEQKRQREAQQMADCEPLVRQDVERTAREIRQSYEKYGNYSDAGDYYIAEMAYRERTTPWSKPFLKVGLCLYGLLSRYGESPGRAVVSFLAVLAGFGVLYSLAGFSIGSINVGRSLSFDLRQFLGTMLDFARGMWLSLINLLPGNLRGETLGVKLPTTLGKLAAVFQVVFSYATLTLFLLAIRRRFRR